MKRMVADGDGHVRGAVFARNKIYKCISGPVFFSHAVGQLLPDTYTLVLSKMESSLYFISSKNCAKSKRFELHVVPGPTLKKTYLK